MEKAAAWNSFSNKLGVAGMKETQGERIMRALVRVFERMKRLEEERQTAKSNINTLDSRADPRNSGFHRTLAMAEARCTLLEQQLQSLQEFLHTASSPDGSKPQPTVPRFAHNGVSKTGSAIGGSKHDISLKSERLSPVSNISNQFNCNSSDHRSSIRNLSSMASASTFERAISSGRQRVRRHSRSSQKHPSSSSTSRTTTLSHYHIEMSDMPFVSSASATSHSLRANIQNLHSAINLHNPNLRRQRGRSTSADRQHCSRSLPMPKWRSLSDVSSNNVREISGNFGARRRSRSRSRTSFRTSSDIMADLDTVPVKLDKHCCSNDNKGDDCDHPGKMCIKTEFRSKPTGCIKTVEVKMTTSSSIPTKLRGKANLEHIQNKRHLLRNVKNMQTELQRDQLL